MEYNQWDLLVTVDPRGDVAGSDGVHSPYPGNINRSSPSRAVSQTLEKTRGVMGEFVNPKYADATKTTFKKPARLECMMQDARALGKEEKVGFTPVDA